MKKFLKVLFFIGALFGVAMLVKKLVNRKHDDEDMDQDDTEKDED